MFMGQHLLVVGSFDLLRKYFEQHFLVFDFRFEEWVFCRFLCFLVLELPTCVDEEFSLELMVSFSTGKAYSLYRRS